MTTIPDSRYKLRNVRQYLIISLIIALVITLMLLPLQGDIQWLRVMREIGLNAVVSILIWVGIEQMVLWFDKWISWLEQPFWRFLLTFITTTSYAIFIVVGSNALYYWVTKGVPFSTFLERAGIGMFYVTGAITLIITLFVHGRGFLMAWKSSLLEVEQIKQAHIAAKFESLKNQVNPHFLFNSFNVLSSLVYKDPDLAAKFIKQLSSVYRYVLDTREKEVVPLQRELDNIEAYIFLMNIRFGDSLKIIQNVVPAHHEMIAPMTLQMLLENAIKHNEISKSYPLDIQINRFGDYISVKNKLKEKSQQQHRSGVGLENIRERYQFISDLSIEVQKTASYFEVKVPIVKLEN